MTTLEMLFAGYCLATGIVMGWLWASAPLKRKVVDLENLVKWERVKAAAAESDLARVRAKLESPRRETKKA
jgi:hypothetical protein